MIVCDICRTGLTGAACWTVTLVVGGLHDSRSMALVHACGPEHFVIALARTARENARQFAPSVINQARAEFDGTHGCDTCTRRNALIEEAINLVAKVCGGLPQGDLHKSVYAIAVKLRDAQAAKGGA